MQVPQIKSFVVEMVGNIVEEEKMLIASILVFSLSSKKALENLIFQHSETTRFLGIGFERSLEAQ